MSKTNVYTCDRCGAEKKVYGEGGIRDMHWDLPPKSRWQQVCGWFRNQEVAMKCGWFRNQEVAMKCGYGGSRMLNWDLCPKCANDLVTFMQNIQPE